MWVAAFNVDGCCAEGCLVFAVMLRQRAGTKCERRHSMMMHAAQGVCCFVGRVLATCRHKMWAATFNGIGLVQRGVFVLAVVL